MKGIEVGRRHTSRKNIFCFGDILLERKNEKNQRNNAIKSITSLVGDDGTYNGNHKNADYSISTIMITKRIIMITITIIIIIMIIMIIMITVIIIVSPRMMQNKNK